MSEIVSQPASQPAGEQSGGPRAPDSNNNDRWHRAADSLRWRPGGGNKLLQLSRSFALQEEAEVRRKQIGLEVRNSCKAPLDWRAAASARETKARVGLNFAALSHDSDCAPFRLVPSSELAS